MSSVLPAYSELHRVAELQVSMEGPNSGGGRSAVVAGDRVYLVVYGDESTLPHGGEQVQAAFTFEQAAQALGGHRVWPEIAAWIARRDAAP